VRPSVPTSDLTIRSVTLRHDAFTKQVHGRVGLVGFKRHTDQVAFVRCAFPDRNLHSRMPLDPTHVRFKRTCVWPMAFLSGVHCSHRYHHELCRNTEGRLSLPPTACAYGALLSLAAKPPLITNCVRVRCSSLPSSQVYGARF
jgi:hypothetical protein